MLKACFFVIAVISVLGWLFVAIDIYKALPEDHLTGFMGALACGMEAGRLFKFWFLRH